MRKSIDLPLHYGSAPKWLFGRMTELSRSIISLIVKERGPEVFLERIADPLWFQALGCLLGFDWHSSGLTTTTCGAMKVAIKPIQSDLGIYIVGGKGKTSRKTPFEISSLVSDPDQSNLLVESSKLSAKVDNSLVDDGFTLYHHSFFFSDQGDWTTVQQGMADNHWARRYHWSSQILKSFFNSPHSGIISDQQTNTLNLASKKSKGTREGVEYLAKRKPEEIIGYLERLEHYKLEQRHSLKLSDLNPRSLKSTLLKSYQGQPESFKELVKTEGIGLKTIRALALVSEIVYGTKTDWQDPARFAYAHGGKDGYPYPVNRRGYDQTIKSTKDLDILERATRKSKLSQDEKDLTLKKIYLFYQDQ